MTTHACPHLGMKEDRNTALQFPSEGNFCYNLKPIKPISRTHQSDYCLTDGYEACPLFAKEEGTGIPSGIISPIYRRRQERRIFFGSLAFIFILGLVMILRTQMKNVVSIFDGFLMAADSTEESTPPLSFTSTAANAVSNPLPSPSITETEFATPTFVAAKISSGELCPPPTDWVPYTVKPTDSIFRLSIIYGVSVEELQSANCLGESTYLRSGQEIFVPPLPTDTPEPARTATPSPSPTPTVFYVTFTPTSTEKSQPPRPPKPTNTPPPPTPKPTNTPNPTPKPTNTPGEVSTPTLAP